MKTIAELRRLEQDATRGPWEPRCIGYGHYEEVVRRPDGSPDDGGDIVVQCWHKRDTALIAATRNALPSLLTRAELLDEALDKIRRVRACWYLDPDAIALIDTFLARVTALDDKEQP